tara:strand:- start:1306 stop:2232 length:927 start_codon:yes stop_codon:yes gene_type:complete
MIKKKILIITIILISLKVNAQVKNTINIVARIDDQIITNIDVEKEINYLIAINNELQTIEYSEMRKFAEESLIKEVIKKKELEKHYELNVKNDYLENYIVNFYNKINLNSIEEFEVYLSQYDLKIDEIRSKFEVEVIWNEFIYTNYKEQLNIDIEAIKKKVNKKKIKTNSYLLSEILFQIKDKGESRSKYQEIINSINKIGFVNTANIYSISTSSKSSGDIGWINEGQLSKKIHNSIKELKVGDISKPIIVPGGMLVLKVNDKKKENLDFDKEEELKKIIAYEKNKQFNRFSLIHYNKIKFNSKINEK